MLYRISRDGQIYGPYTVEDLERYVSSGNVLLTDLAKTDEMAEWIPVGQVLGRAAATQTDVAVPGYPAMPPAAMPQGTYTGPAGVYPDAPNLHWGLVLLIDVFTCSLFMFAWNLVLSSWMRRVKPNSTAIFYYVAGAVLALLSAGVGSHLALASQMHSGLTWNYLVESPIRIVLSLGAWVVRLIARFTMRADLEEHFNTAEPVGLSLSGVMTFFFGGLYFQYHLNRINELKRMARYRGAAI
jgi:GYF domain 2